MLEEKGKTMTKILAGDIGGTNTRLAIFECQSESVPVKLTETDSSSASWKSLEEAIAAFLSDHKTTVSAGCLAVAGSVNNGASKLTNLSWYVDTAALQKQLGLEKIQVRNDVEAIAISLSSLSATDLIEINAGVKGSGNMAVIAAGTGLGQAASHPGEGNQTFAIASEGGHSALGATNTRQLELLADFLDQGIEPSWESVLSGAGIVRIYEHLRRRAGEPLTPDWLAEAKKAGETPAGAIGKRAIDGSDPQSVETIDRFIEYYGNQASNLALTVMATGGIFIGGGIAPRIKKLILSSDTFMKAFARGRHKELLAKIPVHLVVNENPGLLGAAIAAARSLAN